MSRRDTIEKLRVKANLASYERDRLFAEAKLAVARYDAAENVYEQANDELSMALANLCEEEPLG